MPEGRLARFPGGRTSCAPMFTAKRSAPKVQPTYRHIGGWVNALPGVAFGGTQLGWPHCGSLRPLPGPSVRAGYDWFSVVIVTKQQLHPNVRRRIPPYFDDLPFDGILDRGPIDRSLPSGAHGVRRGGTRAVSSLWVRASRAAVLVMTCQMISKGAMERDAPGEGASLMDQPRPAVVSCLA
jgi:hypothetical protein